MINRTSIKWVLPAVLLPILICIYALYDPAEVSFFPACPFHSLTGWLCPGCGSQRAIHHILNLQFSAAFSKNPLLVISLPYIITYYGIAKVATPSKELLKWRRILYGRTAIFIILFIIISFWILRNLFPQ